MGWPGVLRFRCGQGGAVAVKLLVRRLVRTLSVPVRGVCRFASLSARTFSGQGRLFT